MRMCGLNDSSFCSCADGQAKTISDGPIAPRRQTNDYEDEYRARGASALRLLSHGDGVTLLNLAVEQVKGEYAACAVNPPPFVRRLAQQLRHAPVRIAVLRPGAAAPVPHGQG